MHEQRSVIESSENNGLINKSWVRFFATLILLFIFRWRLRGCKYSLSSLSSLFVIPFELQMGAYNGNAATLLCRWFDREWITTLLPRLNNIALMIHQQRLSREIFPFFTFFKRLIFNSTQDDKVQSTVNHAIVRKSQKRSNSHSFTWLKLSKTLVGF